MNHTSRLEGNESTASGAASEQASAPDAKHGFALRWWGVAGLLLFIAGDLALHAQEMQRSPQIIAVAMGEIIGAMLIAVFVAWLFWRLMKRSRQAGTAVFTVMLALVLLGLFLPERVVTGTRQRFPTFGVALSPPRGWIELPREKHNTVVQWAGHGSTPAGMTGLIAVEAGIAQTRSVEVAARDIAQHFGGSVVSDPVELDGVRALRVHADANSSALHPTDAIVAMHGGLSYLIMGGISARPSCAADLEEIRRSWKWIEIESPARHVEFQDRAVPALGGVISINFPRFMRTYPSNASRPVLDLGYPNPRRNAPDFLAYVQLAPKDAASSFDDVRARFLEGIKRFAKEPPTWHQCHGNSLRYITQDVEYEGMPGVDGRTHVLWAMVPVDSTRIVLINFTLAAQTTDERAAFSAVAARIVESIVVLPQPTAGR